MPREQKLKQPGFLRPRSGSGTVSALPHAVGPNQKVNLDSRRGEMDSTLQRGLGTHLG